MKGNHNHFHIRCPPKEYWFVFDMVVCGQRVVYGFREGRGAMVRAWRFVAVAACRAVSRPAWCGIFREMSCFSPLNLGDFVSLLWPMLYPWARHLTLNCFTWLRWKWVVPGRTGMTMCTISSMRRNSCRTVYSPWSWNDTRPVTRGVKCKVGW